jgi:hypothetical protein
MIGCCIVSDSSIVIAARQFIDSVEILGTHEGKKPLKSLLFDIITMDSGEALVDRDGAAYPDLKSVVEAWLNGAWVSTEKRRQEVLANPKAPTYKL